MSHKDLFKKMFKIDADDIPTSKKRELEKKSEGKRKRRKVDSYFPIRVKNEQYETYDVYFVKFSKKKDKMILYRFGKLLEENQDDDLVRMEDMNKDPTLFDNDEINAIKKFLDLHEDLFGHFKVKGDILSGRFNKEFEKIIETQVTDDKEIDEDGDEEIEIDYDKYNQEDAQEWALREMTQRSFIDKL